MSISYIIGLAVALAMDAFAVSIGVGIQLKKISLRQIFRLSCHFGLFQALMPILGWTFGSAIRQFTESYAHWIAFGLLALIGTNMLREAFSNNDERDSEMSKDSPRGITLVALSVATSIDALAAGLSLSMLNVSILMPALIIGIVACLFTIVGIYVGRKIAQFDKLSLYAEVLGGVVVWGIGLHILWDKFA